MDRFASVDDALDFAMAEEQKAAEWYASLASFATGPGMRAVFEQFAAEEKGHRAKLESVKAGRGLLPAARRVTSLSVTDYMSPRDASPGMSYQDALLVAMQKEKAAYRMYSDLAAASGDDRLRELFLSLAREEANHKLRFELEYDIFVTPEN
jgi:rubrerythrin